MKNRYPFYANKSATFIKSAQEYYDRIIDCIKNTKKTIHIQTYIFIYDNVGKRILDELQLASQRGVEVFLCLDSFGSMQNINTFSNIQLRWFNPFFGKKSYHWGRRLHHKIAIFDDEIALVGGINIGETFLDWIDMAIEIQGPIVLELEKIAQNYFDKARPISNKEKDNPIWEKRDLVHSFSQTHEYMRYSLNDWMKGKNEIYQSYLVAIRSAKKSIVLINGYFMPGRRILHALYNAKKRGVNVQLILGSKLDVSFLPYAVQFLYPQMIANGIEIYHIDSCILHAKIAIVDDIWTTHGSFNLNFIAYYGDIETNIEIYNNDYALGVKNHIQKLVEEHGSKLSNEKILPRIYCWIFYMIFLVVRSISMLFINVKGRDKMI